MKKPVSIIRPAAEDPEHVELDSQGRPYHATEVLSGRRTPVRVKPPVEEPADPSRTVDLEAERIDAEHTARQALLRLHARTQPTRAELASMLVSRKIEQMERGNPAFEKDPSQEGDSDSIPDRNEDARSKGWNSLWGNGVRDAEAEQNALVDVRRPPRYAFDEDERPQVERDEAYARRMDAWEKDVMAESESRDRRVSCRGPKPGPRVPVHTGTHETLGGFPTPHQTRLWKAEGAEGEERESRLDVVRGKAHPPSCTLVGARGVSQGGACRCLRLFRGRLCRLDDGEVGRARPHGHAHARVGHGRRGRRGDQEPDADDGAP